MFKMMVSGKATDYKAARPDAVGYAGLFTLKYRGFMGDNKTEKEFVVLVGEKQTEFAQKQCEKGYTVIIEAQGLRAWVDNEGVVRLALDKVNLIIP
jgi:single-stranded DNA-binding protein